MAIGTAHRHPRGAGRAPTAGRRYPGRCARPPRSSRACSWPDPARADRGPDAATGAARATARTTRSRRCCSDEYAKLISRSGGIGIADAVLRELLRAQEAS